MFVLKAVSLTIPLLPLSSRMSENLSLSRAFLEPSDGGASHRQSDTGNHIARAARDLGWAHLAAVVVELDDAAANAYLLADNRSSDASEIPAYCVCLLRRMARASSWPRLPPLTRDLL